VLRHVKRLLLGEGALLQAQRILEQGQSGGGGGQSGATPPYQSAASMQSTGSADVRGRDRAGSWDWRRGKRGEDLEEDDFESGGQEAAGAGPPSSGG
jgi:hypothetical protein